VALMAMLGLLAVLFASGDDPGVPSQVAPTWPEPSPTSAAPTRGADLERTATPRTKAAREAIGSLPVKGRAPMTGYTREAFGTAWTDTNDNGCDTRNDILRRDLRDKRVVDCVVMSGMLEDPYSGQVVPFERGPVTSLDVQIDHVVSLGNAWATGAAYWTDAKRERFANDRRNLLAVRGDLNMQKQDGDTATWLPPRKAFRCAYVSLQVLTKQRYGLWVTPAEKAAMSRVLAGC
jgi:hypothetical protein